MRCRLLPACARFVPFALSSTPTLAQHSVARQVGPATGVGSRMEVVPTVTGRGSLPRPAVAALMVLVALAVVSWSAGPAGAQSVLVSNIGQDEFSADGFIDYELAQSFTTGTHAAGYTLTSVELRLSHKAEEPPRNDNNLPTVRLLSGSATGTEVAVLTGSGEVTIDDEGSEYTFTAPANTTLSMSTAYWVVAVSGVNSEVSWGYTDTGNEDGTPAVGWTISNNGESRDRGTTDSFDSFEDSPYMIRVNGTAKSSSNSTGKPTITGAAVVGQTLTAATGTIADPDGLPSAFTYQWIRVDGQTETDISTATSSTYTLVAADQGKTVKVKISFTDNDGNAESRTSDAYPGVGSVAASVTGCTSPTLTGRTQVWQGKLTVGKAETQAIGSTAAKQVGWGWDKFTGTLTNRDLPIVLGANRYKIGDLVMLFDYGSNLAGLLAPPDDTLVLNLDKPPTAAEQADLRLHVCNSSFNFADATGPKGVSTKPGHKTDIDWYWENPMLTWSAGLQRLLILSATSTALATLVNPPTVSGTPAVSAAGPDGQWTEGEAVEVTVTFSEAVVVNTTGGAPSIGIGLGGTKARNASYVRGTGTTALVFSYTLVAGDGSHSSMAVTPNSLALNGGTIRSQATQADASLGHNGAAVLGNAERGRRNREETPRRLTAAFESVPSSHNGSTAFLVQLRFSEEVDLSYTAFTNGLLTVTGGTVSKARRLQPPSNIGWEITVTPSGNGDVVLTLPANRACNVSPTVCTSDGRQLARSASVTVPGPELPELTAAFESAPSSHNGSTAFLVQLRFSEEVDLSYTAFTNGLLTVTGGTVSKARRLQPPSNIGWEITVTPSGNGDVVLTLPANRACNVSPTVCTSDGRQLAQAASVTVSGPGSSKAVVAPLRLALDANYPNPFNTETQIAYILPAAGRVALVIYNVLGQWERTLVEGLQSAGRYQVAWDGRNEEGAPVTSGVYFYRLISEQGALVRRLLLLK